MSGHVYSLSHLDNLLGAQAIGDKVLDGDDGHVVFFSHFHQLRQSCHGAIGVDNLYERCCRLHSCQAGEVDSRLGVSSTLEHALVLSTQWIDVSWSAKVGSLSVGVGKMPDCLGAVVHRHAGGASLKLVDGHGERCSQHRGVVVDLHCESQLLAPLGGDRCAQHSPALAHHEVDLLLGNALGGDDEIALVLTVLIVDNNHKLSLAELLNCLVDSIQFKFIVISHV